MRLKEGRIYQLSKKIEEDITSRETSLSKPQRIGLADIAASALARRSVNTTELSSVLPHKVKDQESCFRYIHHWLSNDKIDPQSVIKNWNQELMKLLSARGETLVLMLDQSKIADGFEVLMVSIRTKERAIPVSGTDIGILKIDALEQVRLCDKVLTNLDYLQEPGHEEPWIIAMDGKPTCSRTLDYGLRWGIESMFSDLKSRGFKLTDTRLKTVERLARLLLVLSTAMMWAVSTEWLEHAVEPVKKLARSLLSAFTAGIRIIRRAVFYHTNIPNLWLYLKSIR